VDLHIRFVFLLSLAPLLFAASTDRPHLFLSFSALQQLDALSADRVESLEDATAYVTKAATQFGIADPSFIPGGLASRFAAAELAAAKDPDKLVSDEQVAEAFNFLSDEFHVANPERLTGADILLYRGVKASMYPHLYSPKSVGGSRPLGALIMLDTLICEGGINGWGKEGGVAGPPARQPQDHGRADSRAPRRLDIRPKPESDQQGIPQREPRIFCTAFAARDTLLF
jgi:hypothetical protein